MRAVLVHHSLDACGGAEFVAVSTLELLNELGFSTDLITIKKPDFSAIEKTFNTTLEINKSHFILPSHAHYNQSVYSQFLFQSLTLPLIVKTNPDLVINTHADIPLPYFKAKVPLISYVHYPHLPHFVSLNDYPVRYQRSSLWKLYFSPYAAASNLLCPLLSFSLKKSLVLTNSKYSQNAIKCIVPKVHSMVVRPPVDTSAFSNNLDSGKREKKVLVIGRFAPEKKLEVAIDICNLLDSDITMTFMGTCTSSTRSLNYLQKLKKKVKQFGLDNRISLLTNVDRSTMNKHMMTSSVYLHTNPDEHFGISIIEAVSGGLIPVVPDSGGPKEFIPKCYLYKTIDQAADLVKKNVNKSQSERMSITKIAENFSKEKFKTKMHEIIKIVQNK